MSEWVRKAKSLINNLKKMSKVLANEEGIAYNVASARSYAAVTKSDTTVLAVFRAIYIGGEGAVKVGLSDGTAVIFSGLSAGSILPVYGNRIYSTDTTATLMVALRD